MRRGFAVLTTGLVATVLAAGGVGVAVAGTGGPPATTAVDDVFTVYLDPAGSDARDGRSPQAAVRSLARAHQILHAEQPRTDVEIRIKQGTYVQGQMAWNFHVPGRSVSFLPVDYQLGDTLDDIAGRPVFRGPNRSASEVDHHDRLWLQVRPGNGYPAGDFGLRFYYLTVERYTEYGLLFNGGFRVDGHGYRVPDGAGVNGNTLYGMEFRNIGTRHTTPARCDRPNPQHCHGFAGVAFINSSHNRVANSHFVNLEDRAHELPGTIHGVYLQHHSTHNVVARSRFQTISGDPVRTRNLSSFNDFDGNRYVQAGRNSAFNDWYCNPTCVAENSDALRGHECASEQNRFRNSTLDRDYQGARLRDWSVAPAPGGNYDIGEAPRCAFHDSRPSVCTGHHPQVPRVCTWNNRHL